MRRQRVRMSISVWLSMWPICRRPVTLGGGSRIVNTSVPCGAQLLQILGAPRRLGGLEQPLLNPVLRPAILNRPRGSYALGSSRRAGFSGVSVMSLDCWWHL